VNRTIYTDSGVGTAAQKAKTRDEILEAVKPGKKEPLVIFPEGTCNNCNIALMQYQKFVFGLGVPVIPIALKIWNPWPIEYMMTFGPIEGNLLTFLFMPMVVYNFQVMDPETIGPDETDGQFASRVQKLTAEKLGTGISNFNFRHKEHMMEAVNGQLDERYWKSQDAAQECYEFRCDMASRGGLVGLSHPDTRTMRETPRLLAKRRRLIKIHSQMKKKRGKAKITPK